MSRPNPTERAHLRALAYRFPTVEAALAEVAHLRAVLTLPKGTIHVVSDVHGEFKKLEHILRNASGSLRPLVEQLFATRLSPPERLTLLALIYYPRETYHELAPRLADDAARERFVRDAVARGFEVLRALAGRYTLRHADRVVPAALQPVFRELLFAAALGREARFRDALLAPYLHADHGLELLRAIARAIRALSVFELIVAGDLGDRGPRVDLVIDAIRRHGSASITFGNHDAEWMGACLGQEALIATVARVSLRYGRIAQLEEGYGIPVEAIEKLARTAYGDDPCERFAVKSGAEDLRDPLLLARMQKAMAILQFKLEGQTTRRNPHFEMEHRNLLHRIDPARGTVTIDGTTHPLLDTRFPTIDWSDPYALSPAEAECMAHLKGAFYGSARLWEDMSFVAQRGRTYLLRDDHVIFHGCVPVDEGGAFQSFPVDGVARAGRALFDALDEVIQRAFRERRAPDVDLLYYLWAGARSPMFGKDRMATFETYFVADKRTHVETKNPYFKLIHDAEFCRRVASELGARDPSRALIVNGHVPVKLEQGESPLKQGGMAVTIDGAFSEAYGDRGYTLVLDAARTYLAQHHHFESVQAAITAGADIIPVVTELRRHEPPRTVDDTPQGESIRSEIADLERLIDAFRSNELSDVVR